MNKILKFSLMLLTVGVVVSSCQKESSTGIVRSDPFTIVSKVSVVLPANYSADGVNASVSDFAITSLGLTADEFTSEFGKSVKFGYATSPEASAVQWVSENSDGQYGHWFDANGNVAASGSAGVLHIQSNCQWGKSTTGISSFNVNLAPSAYTQGSAFKVYQALGHDTATGITDIFFIEWNVKVNEEKTFAEGSASFSPTAGIIANINMAPTQTGNEYTTLEVSVPETVYTMVKQLSGYDALAYFIASGQISSYAFPGASTLGDAGTDFWFDSKGAVAEQASAVVNLSLYLESGNPVQGGGKEVKLLVKPNIGAAVTVGTNFKCGFLFVYGTTKIPFIANITVVDSL